MRDVLRRKMAPALALLLGLPGAALAQRASENAISAADDAFGTRVGNESLGLYDVGNARGFSPVTAGNVRIEGLYFDQQPGLNDRLVRGTAVRVGISAQSYAFPAPTGIADYRLRLPGDELVVSTVARLGPYSTKSLEVDAQFPIVGEKLSVGLGAGVIRLEDDFTVKSTEYNGGILARLRPTDGADITAFYGRTEDCKGRTQPRTFTNGLPIEPRHPPKRTTFGQDWQNGDCTESNAGMIGSVALPADWTLRAGVFRSAQIVNKTSAEIYMGVDANGIGRHTAYLQPPLSFRSYSGEVRLARTVREGPRRHTIDMTMRGRNVRRDFGGSSTVDLGIGPIYSTVPVPEPVFNLGPTGDDRSRQGTVGIAYDGLWAGVGDLGFDVQKTFYLRKMVQPPPALTVAKTNATPLLYSVRANVLVSKSLAVYASYTRGFEETGPAANTAANRGEAQPVSMTKQADAGLRYLITPKLTMVAGVFQVEKPYFNVNAANIYGPLGVVRHRGVEFSVTGEIFTPGLRAVGGMVLIDPQVSGPTVDAGLIGPVATGVKPRNALLTLQYQPPAWRGFGIDGQVNHAGPQYAHQDNAFKIQGNTQLNLGARYNFKAGEIPAQVRFQALNVTDVFAYNLSYTGAFLVRSPRRFIVTLAADF
jgi:iron complex outermembrane receptor protein